MISFLPSLTESDANKPASIARVADHIVYVSDKIGYEHVGIGSDLDGVMTMVPGLDNVTKFPALVAELVKRKIPEAALKGVLGMNFLRVFAKVESVAKEIRDGSVDGRILSDVVEPIFDDALREEMVRKRTYKT
jgi:membrane dipeptidase